MTELPRGRLFYGNSSFSLQDRGKRKHAGKVEGKVSRNREYHYEFSFGTKPQRIAAIDVPCEGLTCFF